MAGWNGGFNSFKSGALRTNTPIRAPRSTGVLGSGAGRPRNTVGTLTPVGVGRNPTPRGTTIVPRAPVVAPPTPGAGPGGGATPGAPPAPSPYDATYFSQLANATLKANQQIGTYNADIQNAGTSLGNTLAQLQFKQGLAVENAQDRENQLGGFAQGALGKTIGNLNQAYLYQRGGLQNKYQQDVQNWNRAIAGIRQGLSLEQIALGLAAADRQAAITARNPAAGPVNAAANPLGGGARAAAGRPPVAPRVVSSRPERQSSRPQRSRGRAPVGMLGRGGKAGNIGRRARGR